MTELFQELERKLATLPEDEQERWISRFLEALTLGADNIKIGANREHHWIGGRRPTQEEVAEAIERLREIRKGNILGDDITLKDLINEGRRY